MSETKNEKFKRLRDTRVPKITHALGLLQNLSGSSYESSMKEREELVDTLYDAVDQVAQAFGVDIASEPSPPSAPEPIIEKSGPLPSDDGDVKPTDIADGGASAKSEIAWAFDALQRGDKKLAQNRIKRVLDIWR